EVPCQMVLHLCNGRIQPIPHDDTGTAGRESRCVERCDICLCCGLLATERRADKRSDLIRLGVRKEGSDRKAALFLRPEEIHKWSNSEVGKFVHNQFIRSIAEP